tara:strand:- start:18 stop:1109 length:1092 start_codon:yes stop_codon:yes gene_type:complete
MRTSKLFLIAIIVSISFIYGLGIGVYHWFPYEHIKAVKQHTMGEYFDPADTLRNFSFVTTHKNQKYLLNLRDQLLSEIIPNSDSNVVSETNSESETLLQNTYYGIKTNAVLTRSALQGKCLRIYIQGHGGGNPQDYDYHNELKRELLSDGCDVLSMSMLGLGLNAGPASFPSRFGLIKLIKLKHLAPTTHGNYSLFYDANNPYLDPLSLFIYPHFKLINHVIGEYEDIAIMGISGGGWYAVWLSALMPEILNSISYAGSLPIPYRIFSTNVGDWEQIYSPLYSKVTYFDLYQLMTLNSTDSFNRKVTLVYNSDDNCCFLNPYAAHFKKYSDNLSSLQYNVIIDESDTHTMNVELVLSLLEKME